MEANGVQKYRHLLTGELHDSIPEDARRPAFTQEHLINPFNGLAKSPLQYPAIFPRCDSLFVNDTTLHLGTLVVDAPLRDFFKAATDKKSTNVRIRYEPLLAPVKHEDDVNPPTQPQEPGQVAQPDHAKKFSWLQLFQLTVTEPSLHSYNNGPANICTTSIWGLAGRRYLFPLSNNHDNRCADSGRSLHSPSTRSPH